MRINHRKYAVMHPKSIASTDVLYNGAAAASANGIPLKDANEVIVGFHLGTVSASQTGMAFSLYTSSNSTNVSAVGSVTEINAALANLSKAIDENKCNEIAVQVKDIVPKAGEEENPQYLYVKYAQETADAVFVECIVTMNDVCTQPVALPIEGTTARKYG